MMDQRQIGYHFGQQVTKIDAASRTLWFEEEKTAPFDILIGVPPHRAPVVLSQAGLIDASGYVPVHPKTLQLLSDRDTPYPVCTQSVMSQPSDCRTRCSFPKRENSPRPRHESSPRQLPQTSTKPQPRGPMTEFGGCYVDVGDGLAAYGSGDFYASPGPKVTLQDPSTEARKTKQEYEDLLDKWFLG